MPAKKPKIQSNCMRVRIYPVLTEAVERGTARGWRIAHKHTEKPHADDIMQSISEAVLQELSEAFDFDEVAQ